jgi:subfamily B ATP-binding cassette protein HlyB/CyaB
LHSNWLFATETFVWGLQGMCHLQRIPFAPNLVLQQNSPPYNLASLQHAAKSLGLKAGVKQATVSELAKLPLPCLAVLKPASAPHPVPAANDAVTPSPSQGEGGGEGSTSPHPHRLVLILKATDSTVLLFDDKSRNAFETALKDFASDYAGQVVLFIAGEKGLAASDPALKETREFGFKWFIPELLKHKQIWRDVLLASLAIQLMALATPIFTQIVIDKVIVHHTISTLWVIAIGMIVFMVFSGVMTWVRQYLVLHTGNRIDAVLGKQVFEHLFKLPPRYFDHRPTGVLIARVHGVETIREFISGAAVTLCLDVPFLFIFLAIMIYYSGILTLVSLAALAIMAVMSFLVTPLLRERLNQQFLLGARNQAFLTEYVSGMETVKSLQMEPQLNSRFGEYLAAYLKAGFGTRQLSNSFNVAANMVEQLQTLAILCVGAWLVINTTDMTIGMLVAFQMFAGRLSGPLLRMVGLWQEFQQANIAVKRLGDVMNAPTEPYSVTPSREAGGKGAIEIRGLSFRYAENLPYLYRDLSLALQPGRCIALMGPSGCGKSTLAKLMQGFYQPHDGAILIDGRDIRHFSANELRQHYGVVPQETMLFSGTIFENLVLAFPHATFEQVIQACKAAEIHETIEKLPEGYQTRIGEHGAGLSGGQKQRIAIARALLKRPKILIFDEATSSLDEATAESFAKTVNQLKGKVSMLFIAHRLPKSLVVDEVVRLGSV